MSEEIKAVEDGIKELGDQITVKMDEYNAELEKYGKADTELTEKLDVLSGEYKELRDELAEIAQKQTPAVPGGESARSAGEEFIKSDVFAKLVSGEREKVRFEVKNTTINSNLSAVFGDSTTVFPNQRAGVIGGDFAPVTIRDRVPSISVSTDAVNALRESAWTTAAVEVTQGAAKPEATIEFEQYNVAIETVAHWIKVSNRLLADAPAIASYINTRLRDGLAQRVDLQLLSGNGTSPNLSGFTDTGNYTAFAPDANANLYDSVNKAKYALWATGNMPDTVVVNPADWGTWERSRENVGSGQYLYGTNGMAPLSLCGVTVVLSNNMSSGSFLIGAMGQGALVYDRQTAVVEMGYVDDDFTRNLVTIRAEERLALSIDKATAFLYGDIATS